MSLDLGTLTGYLDLDAKKFDTVIDKMPGKLKGSGAVMGLAAGVVAAGVGAALSNGLMQGMDFADANAHLSAGLGLTEGESARLGGIAGHLYSQAYGESVADVSNTVGQVVSSIDGMRGATSTTVEAMTAKFLNFNSAFEIDTERATQVVGQMFKSGLVKDANEGMDLLTAAMQRVPAAVRGDILDAVDEYGPFMAQLGIVGSDAMGLLVEGSKKGMYGIDKAGDAVKEFTIRSTDMSKASKVGYDAIGANQTEMTRKILKGGSSAKEAFGSIVSDLLKIKDPAAQSQAALALFGTPLEDLGTGQIPKFLKSLEKTGDGLKDTAGAAERMGAKVNGSPKVAWEQMSHTWDSIVGKLGQQLLPALEAVMGFLNTNPAVLTGVAIALGFLALGFVGVTIATWAMNTALLANPITWIILGIVALIAVIVALAMNWDAVIKWISGVWGGFVSWLTEGLNGLAAWWAGVWDGFLGMLSDAWGGIMAFIGGIPGAILAFFAGVGQWLLDVGHNLLVGLATGIALGFLAVVYFFTQFPTDLLNLLVGAVSWLVKTGGDILAGLGAGIAAGWVAVVAFFTALPGKLWAMLAAANIWLNATGLKILQGLGAGIAAGWVAVVGFFTTAPGKVIAFLSGAPSWLISTGSKLIGGLLNGVKGTWSGFTAFLRGIPAAVGGFFGGIGSWLYNSGRDLINGLLDGVKSLAGTIGGFFLGLLPGWIVGPFKAALGIHSPSTVFRGFGGNIGQGIMLGLDDEQAALDARVSSLVTVPSSSASSQARRAAGSPASSAAAAAAGAGITIMGNVGWSAEDLAREVDEKQRQAAALAGLNDVVGVL